MGTKSEKAVENHKKFYSCSASVLCAFKEDAGLDEKTAMTEAKPYAGGKMIKCGAVLSAEYVLRKKFGNSADEKIAEFEKRFTQMNSSLNCRELKGGLTGKMLRSCRGCVTDASLILEEMLDS